MPGSSPDSSSDHTPGTPDTSAGGIDRDPEDEVDGLAAAWVGRTRHLRGDELPLPRRSEPRSRAERP